MKKILTIVLLLALAFAFSSCSLGAMSDSEAAAIIAENCEKARALEEIVYGVGLPLAFPEEDTGEWKAAHHVEVAQDCGYSSVDEIKALGEVFSSERRSEMWTYAFEGTDDYLSRYSVNTSGKLTRDVSIDAMGLVLEIYPETAKVKAGNKYSAEVEVEARRKGLSGEEERYKKTLRLIIEDGKWVFDCAVY